MLGSADLYGELRPRAFAIAYQMLGSVSEAEDVVQEAFLRMHQTLQRDEPIASPRAYIATLVTRLAIDQLRSARVRRERYVGEWLPEPLVTDPTPAEHAETVDSLSLAFLVLLESLSPQQRAAFLLREAFDYPYVVEVAEIIGTDVDSTRHLVARARGPRRATMRAVTWNSGSAASVVALLVGRPGRVRGRAPPSRTRWRCRGVLGRF
ncbi:MAG: sigma-70 family RNA polymerase sigma factor [Kribbellaceae bacterium]